MSRIQYKVIQHYSEPLEPQLKWKNKIYRLQWQDDTHKNYLTIMLKKKKKSISLRELKQGLYITVEGWDGEGDGREFQEEGDICIPITDSCWGLTENKIL